MSAMTMGCVAAGQPAAAGAPEPAWEYTGCTELGDGPRLFSAPAPIGADTIDLGVGGGAEFPTAPTTVSPVIPYVVAVTEDIEGTVTMEIERTQALGDEQMGSILHTLGLDPGIAAEPVPDTVELDVVGRASVLGGPLTDERSGRGTFTLTGADPLPGDGLTGVYAEYAVTSTVFELDVLYGGTCVIEASAPADEPIARFHTEPSPEQRETIETAAAEAEAAPARYITIGIGVALMISFVWLAIDHQRKKRAGAPSDS
ncbi:hypothetical protein ACFXKD_05715 [Nocardiopsis aegyptia]|uniref:hypothetical protein n=1 Tax=Nocardiopsis aegyptia TaxID=220378 RepID=UPI003670371C